MTVDDTLVVSEVFGPTIQGEGPSIGRRCSFIRLMGCNLNCSWCDTPYTWDGSRFNLRSEGARQTAGEIATRALIGGPGLVVISGGEPLLNQRRPGWRALLGHLSTAGAAVEVETNGTLIPHAETVAAVGQFNVSPKLAHAGDPEDARMNPAAIAAFAALADDGQAVFKFVAAGPGDLDEVEAWRDTHGVSARHVWVMPLGTTAAEILAAGPALAEAAITAGFNVTTRLHCLLWGPKRGH